MSTRREFLGQIAKAAGAVALGALGGAALASRPKPTYTVEGWPLNPMKEYVFDPPRLSPELAKFLQSLDTRDERKDWARVSDYVRYGRPFELHLPSPPPDGKMYHCAAQWNGEEVLWWIDGERVPYVPDT